ncbi:hypothetical protein I6J18_01690 [Peribacillus psychrosaccharolyticus]|uniref:Uncharacterized protein n=1 Tax=Peribacillus psychrosaccharolyticus TaxID=1407 RepID=A0A974S0S8_PERPY|nr:hypothetical protein [Peribacillus psychrosaccharolyticus]MEC2056134.1 hypothetical protein [Peribacillus psychrosaccharolyticus]MED3745575.1 hypothetical protein [Peribacillus psychrosaccharolyticus]QQT00673.1 hypothetical protein I6J18_01690 [Peribacillus psychrosaccharolyticus]
MQAKTMWGAIAVIALGLFFIIGSTFIEDSANSERYEKAKEKEQSIVKAEQEKEKARQRHKKQIDKATTKTHIIDDSLDPTVLAYRYNKYFKGLKIDHSISFGDSSYDARAFPNDKIVIGGTLSPNSRKFSKLYLAGLNLTEDKEINEFKNIALAFFTSVFNQDIPIKDREGILNIHLDKVMKNGGETMFQTGKIEYRFLNIKDSVIRIDVTNIKNPY